MKKVFLFGMLGLFVVLITGCGQKGTVTCTQKASNDNAFNEIIVPIHEIVIDYEGSKITKATGNYVLDSADEAKIYYDSIYAISVADNNKTDFTLKSNRILNITSQNDIIQLATGNINEKNKDKIVEGLEKAGYTCK